MWILTPLHLSAIFSQISDVYHHKKTYAPENNYFIKIYNLNMKHFLK